MRNRVIDLKYGKVLSVLDRLVGSRKINREYDKQLKRLVYSF
jgi:hypothetical protein